MSHSPDFDLLLDQWVRAACERLVAHIEVHTDALKAQLRIAYAAAQDRLREVTLLREGSER